MSASWLDPRFTVDFIVLAVVAETLLLLALHRWRGLGPGPRLVLPRLLAGLLLMLALRAALMGSRGPFIAFWLALAGVAHVVDLWLSWPRRPR
jgi:hypothetical protein